jgi:magnesium transporter
MLNSCAAGVAVMNIDNGFGAAVAAVPDPQGSPDRRCGMINTVLTGKSGFCWIDVVNPEREELDQIAQTYSLHATAVLDCLDPEHLPKYERFGDTSFIILRAFDETAPAEGETVQELTRKIAVFYGDKFFISIHRKDQPFLAQLREQHVLRARTREIRLSYVLTDLMNAVASSYEKPLDESENTISEFEARCSIGSR